MPSPIRTFLLVAITSLSAGSAFAVTDGNVDDFQSGTTEGWQEDVSMSGIPPTNVANGGPEGTGDRYLENVSDGAGAGGKQVAINTSANWTGDFVAAGINQIQMDVRVDPGSQGALSLRLAFEGANGSRFLSMNAVTVDADGDWHNVTIPFAESTMMPISGAGTFAQTAAAVAEVRLMHRPGGVDWIGVDYDGVVGYDNIATLAVTTFTGYIWETELVQSGAGLLEENCFGPLNFTLNTDDTWHVSATDACIGRLTSNNDPARIYINYDPVADAIPDTEFGEGRSTQPLVSAGGNLFELIGEDVDMGVGQGEERLAVILKEPAGSNLLIAGGAGNFIDPFFTAAGGAVDVLVKNSPDIQAARDASDLEGRWYGSFFARGISRSNVETNFANTGLRVLDLNAGGMCSYGIPSIMPYAEVTGNGDFVSTAQIAWSGGVDLGNRAIFAGVVQRTRSACTYAIDANGHLRIDFTSTDNTEVPPVDSAFSFTFVVSDDNSYMVPAPSTDGIESDSNSLAVRYRAPVALAGDAIDGNYLFYFNLAEQEATGTGHTTGNTGDQLYDIFGRGLVSFDSTASMTPPQGQNGSWFSCNMDLVLDEMSYGAGGEPAMGTVWTYLDVFADGLDGNEVCSFSLAADGGLLLNLEVQDDAGPEDILFSGYVNANGEVMSLVYFETDIENPAAQIGSLVDFGSVMNILAMKYTGDPNGNEDGDEFSNAEEFLFPLPPLEALPQVIPLPDINSDGIEDVAVLREGPILAEIRSGSNGALQKTISFLDDNFDPITAVALPDSDGNSIAELGVMASRISDGRIVVEIRNITGAEAPRSIWFAANHEAVDMAVVDADADNNGIVELAVLSRRNSDGRGLVEVKNAFGPTNPVALWAGPGMTSSDVEVLGDKDANGIPEIAILSTRDSDGFIVAEIKNAAGAALPTAVWFSQGHTAIDMTAVDDKDANGVPEVAVLSRRNSDGRNVVEVKNAAGPTAPSAVWLADGFTATDVKQVHDSDNNGIPEIAALSVRDSDGQILVEVKNAFGPTNLNSVWFSPGFEARGLAILGDSDANGAEEALVLMIRDSDGRILVQGRNTAGSQIPKDYWFSP